VDNLRGTIPEDYSAENNDLHATYEVVSILPLKSREKPGPKKNKPLRSQKISCRLTHEEKQAGEQYCKKHGITEAKLMRASYLASILQPPDERLSELIENLLPLEGENLTINQKTAIKIRAKHFIKRSSAALLLILLGCGMSPVISKGFWFVYEKGKELIYDGHTACIYHTESKSPGCELIEQEPSPPDAAYLEYMKRLQRLPSLQPPK